MKNSADCQSSFRYLEFFRSREGIAKLIQVSRCRTLFWLGLALAGSAPLAGCLPVAVGGAAAGGYTLVTEGRTPSQLAADAAIAAVAHRYWLDESVDLARDVSATVYGGRLLITEIVPTAAMKDAAERRAKQVEGVRAIYNEVQVGAPTNLAQDARDDLASSTLRAKLLGDGNIRSANFDSHALNGIVYILGFARTAAERDLVISYARNLANVTRIVAYIEVGAAQPAAGPASSPAQSAPPPSAGAPPSAAPLSRERIEVTPLP